MTYPSSGESQDPSGSGQRPYGREPDEPAGAGQPGQYPPYGQHGQPGESGPYGQPGQYGQYGQPGGYGQYGQPGYGPAPRTNVMAILSLVFAFVFAPAGIVLGHLARRQIRQSGEQGGQLATWGLVLSYVFTALYVISCCAWLGVLIWASSDGGSGSY